MAAFPTANVCGNTPEFARLSPAEIDQSNRAFAWLAFKLSLVAIALTSAGLGLSALG